MAAKVALVVEHFATLRTLGGKLLRSAVHRHVVLVVAQLGKSLTTLFTLEAGCFVALFVRLVGWKQNGESGKYLH